MKKLLSWLFGSVYVTITGAQPEQVLNLCAREGILLWKTIWQDTFSLKLLVPERQCARLLELAAQGQCSAEKGAHRGLPAFLRRFRRRYALLGGLFLCLVMVGVGSQTILTIEVIGNQDLTSEEIISQLRLCGVGVGSFGPAIPIREKENQLMMVMDQLSVCALNRRGTCLEVIVREREETPAVREEAMPTDVIASATGIITHIEPWTGDAQFEEGDLVVKGDILISGLVTMDPPPNVWLEDGAEDMGSALVHADGKVLAHTYHTLSASLDLNTPVKAYTGEETTRYSLSVMGKRMKIYKNSGIPYEKYDTMIRFKSWTPVEGRTLPIVWAQETFREYTLDTAPLDIAQGEEMLRRELLRDLEETLDQGEVLETEYQCEIQGDVLTVKLLAQCSEQIGRQVPMDTQERVHGPTHPPYPSDEGSPDTKESQTTEDSP